MTQFFTRGPGGFQVKKQIRNMVVFSLQNVIKDPPFSRLDLVSCRNLMIYMDSVLQKKLIPLFHYTLNPGGILFLGTSESIGGHTELFQPVDSKWKVFKRKISFGDKKRDFPGKSYYDVIPVIQPDEKNKLPAVPEIQTVLERMILDEYAPAGILINDSYEILHFLGKTDRYLMPPTGKPNFNLLDMAREDLKKKLTITIHKAVQEKKNMFCKGVRIKHNGTVGVVDISVKPMAGKGLPSGLMLVLFEDTPSADLPGGKKAAAGKAKKQDIVLQSLEQELQSTREYLQATIEELETANEELNSANEELQSTNEELQSANEELETSKEELQSTNEELATVNAELQSKVDEYSRASDDMDNLLAATEIATIFVDTSLSIKGFTPTAAEVINLIQTDIGRPLDDLKTRFSGIDLVGLAGNVLKDLNTLELEILSKDNLWYSLKIIPYRTAENIIDGVVMTFMNIHKVKQADKLRRLATVLNDSNDAVTVLDLEGKILAWNKGAQEMYGWTESEALKMHFSGLMPEDKQDELPSLIERLKRGEEIKSFTSRRRTKAGKIIKVWLTVTALKDESGRPFEIATTERDLAFLARKGMQ
ncbi:MAG: PAS domain-containing protein [Desulfobacterales bacterium]|nr:PAS domain-containing protein [Desulfobacterales bacterium]